MKEIIPVVSFTNLDDALRCAEIAEKAGLKTIEITFRSGQADLYMAEIAKRFNLKVGAGTVLTLDNLKKTIDSGADFAVAPGFNRNIVEAAVNFSFDFFPGICTPGEIEQGIELGVKTFKFFPAEAAGGLKFLTSIAAPYRHLGLDFMATGGINTGNASAYLECSDISAVGGTWIFSGKLQESGDYSQMKQNAVEAVKIMNIIEESGRK
jgi:Entner-Doudoroff aldolase